MQSFLSLERTCDWCGVSEVVPPSVPPWDRVVVQLTPPRFSHPFILQWDVCPACAQTAKPYPGPYPTEEELHTLWRSLIDPGPKSTRVGQIFRDALRQLAQVLRTPGEPLAPPGQPEDAPKGGNG